MKRAHVRWEMVAILLWCGWPMAAVHAATGYAVSYDVVQTGAGGSQASQQMIEIVPGHARITMSGQPTMLFDFQQRTIWVLDDAQQTATRLEIAKLAGLMQQTQGTMAKVMEQLPPDQRAQTAEMLQQLGGPPAAAVNQAVAMAARPRATGQRQVINGYACESYTIQESSGTRTEWRTDHAPPEVTEPAFLQLQAELYALFREMLAAMPQASQFMGSTLPTGTAAPEDKFVVRQETRSAVMTFRSISKREFAPMQFGIPAGYREVNMIPKDMLPGQ